MKHAARARAELGIKTLFNILGPMTNPAGVRRQLVGAFSEGAAQMMAGAFSQLDPLRVLVIHSHDGLDEVSLEANTMLFEIEREISHEKSHLEPGLFGLQAVRRDSILGGSSEANAAIALRILGGEKSPHRDIVLANSALGLMAAGKTRSVPDAVLIAAESIDSGSALRKLEELRAYSTR
jgi:anthranilate phosphoribosyltransferase